MKNFFILCLLSLSIFCTCSGVYSLAENDNDFGFETQVEIEATYINTTATMTAHFTVNPNAGSKLTSGQWEFNNDVWGVRQQLIVYNETGAPVNFYFTNIDTISNNAPYERILWKQINYENDLNWANMGHNDTQKYYSFGVNDEDITVLKNNTILASKFDSIDNRSTIQYLQFRCGLSWVQKTTLVYSLVLTIELSDESFIPQA